MVLHDPPSGVMNHLECFIDRAGAGARFIRTFRQIAFRSTKEIVASIEPCVLYQRRCRIMKIASFKAGPTATYGP
jgi:hypothetical protein